MIKGKIAVPAKFSDLIKTFGDQPPLSVEDSESEEVVGLNF